VQLQVTPPLALSFDTVADTDVLLPGTTLVDSGDKTTEMDRDGVPGDPGCEDPPPQAEMNSANIKVTTAKRGSPLIPFLKFIWTSKS
jgi:hypothetical protein